MNDPNITNAHSSSGAMSRQEAFVRAFRAIAGETPSLDPSPFFPILTAIANELTAGASNDTSAQSALRLGQEFTLVGHQLELPCDVLFRLACQVRDVLLAEAIAAKDKGGGPPGKSWGTAYFDAFLRGVATESAQVEARAYHRKLREANRFILQERRRYYSIFKRMAEPAFIIDYDLCLLETNRAFDHFFAIRGKEHIGKSCYAVLGEEFRTACDLNVFLHARQGQPGIEIDLKVHGEPRSIIVNGTFLGDINHESSGGIVILQDMTPRRDVERALRDSERQYRSLVENVPDVTWRLNQAGEFVFISANAQQIYGYSAVEMLGVGGVPSVADGKSGTDPREEYGRSFRLGRIHPDDRDLVRNQFTLFFASHLPVSASSRRLLKQLPAEVLDEGGGRERNYDVKYRFQKKDGNWVWIHERASRIEEQGGEWYADGVTSDITALKMAEVELERHHFRLAELVDERTSALRSANLQLKKEIAVRRQTEQALMDLTKRLASSNQELDQFAHVASHDLKEPLMLIMAFSDRLLKKCSAQLDDKGQEYLSRIRSAAEHMRQLIEGFLSLSQVTSGARPYEEVDLADLVREVLQNLEERIKESNARIEIGQLGRLGGDRVQLRQLFQNIIANALKYRKAEGQPLVVLQGNLVGDEYYEILIQDNGIGFDPQDAERIFKPLERLHSRREYEGTGMGLTTCQKIVARHGGEICARGELGQGATFIIRLPADLLK